MRSASLDGQCTVSAYLVFPLKTYFNTLSRLSVFHFCRLLFASGIAVFLIFFLVLLMCLSRFVSVTSKKVSFFDLHEFFTMSYLQKSILSIIAALMSDGKSSFHKFKFNPPTNVIGCNSHRFY